MPPAQCGLCGPLDRLVADRAFWLQAQGRHAGWQVVVDLITSVALSAILFGLDSRVPEELTTEGIKGVVEAFRKAAVRAKAAGFDVIEVHGCLLHQFLSPLAGQRTDEYGDSHAASVSC
ncbi:hypothetical protein ABTY20_04025 [Streptomyces sp. NPDC126497]|uniref:oxidoreductase n=1 Tax=Streptomyces sp. NPDC126497 TaxID=3155313 RepID=UPI00332B62FB